MSYRMLLIFAHPDDESFALGGTIAKAAQAGVNIQLVSATRGEAGKTGGLCEPEELGAFREKELARAAQRLGISQLNFLGYRDKTVPAVPAVEILEQLTLMIRGFRPHVVITFGADGASGHMDHRAIHQWTKAAVRFSASPEAPEWGEPYALPRLCYVRPMWRSSEQDGFRPDFVIDVQDWADIKWQAIQEHKTQILSIRKFANLPAEVKEIYFNQESFNCDRELSAQLGGGNDLFSGLN